MPLQIDLPSSVFPRPQPKRRCKLGRAPEICQASPPFPSCCFAPHRCATPLALCPILAGRNRDGLFSAPGAWGSPWCFGSDLGTEDPGRTLQTRRTLAACVKTPSCANTSFKQAKGFLLPGENQSDAQRGSAPSTQSQGRRLSLMSWSTSSWSRQNWRVTPQATAQPGQN